MIEKTSVIINQFDNALLLRNAGRIASSPWTFSTSWDQARREAASPTWGDVQIDGRNELTGRIHDANKERFRSWNKMVREIKPRSEAIVAKAALSVDELGDLFYSIRWDVLNCLLAVEFSDVITSDFFEKQLDVYLEGHLTCGWRGEFPAGSFVVF